MENSIVSEFEDSGPVVGMIGCFVVLFLMLAA